MHNLFKNIEYCSLKGVRAKNEDFFYADNSLLIIGDGATGIGKNYMGDKLSDAAWFSRIVVNRLKNELKIKNDEIPYILSDIIQSVKVEYKKAAGNEYLSDFSPSMSIIIVRKINKKIEIFSLGDCTTFIEDRNGNLFRILDKSVPNMDNEVLRLMKWELKNKKYDTLYQTRSSLLIKQKMLENRKMKNRKNGYWILDITGEGIEHAFHTTIDEVWVKHILIMSDGFYDGFKIFKKASCTEKEFYDSSVVVGVDIIANFIRNTFVQDSECQKFERVTAIDDITVISAEVN